MGETSKRSLGEIMTLHRGYDLPSSLRSDGCYPVISSSGISDYHSDYKVDGPNVVTGRYGTIGKVTYYDGPCWPLNTTLYVSDFHNNHPRYVSYLLEATLAAMPIDGTDKSTVPGVDRNVLHLMKVPFVEQGDQARIVAILSALDNKIANNRKLMTELEETARLIYDYWFTQFDFPDENGNPYRSSGGKMVYNETLHREIPEGWNIVTLEEIAEINRGVSYSSSNLSDSGTPMINLASFSPGGEYLVDGIKYYVGDYSEDKKLRPYDLVICNTQQTALDPSKDIIGKSLLVPDLFSGDILSSHHVTTVNVGDDRLKSYLFAFFRSAWFNSYITGFASGTSILGLDNKGLLATPVLIPCERALEQFAKYQLCIEQNKNRLLKETIGLSSLRDWLLPMLMNGQVSIGK